MVNLAQHFKLTDERVIRDVNAGVLKMFLKRWGKGKRFEDLRPVFVARKMSSDPGGYIRWRLDSPLLAKHVSFTELTKSLYAFAKGHLIELRPFLDRPEIQRKLLKRYGTDVI